MHAGLRTLNSAFPTGAMWAAAEAHARRLINCVNVKLFAAAATGGASAGARGACDGDGVCDGDEIRGGGLYRCSAQDDWQRSTPTVWSTRYLPSAPGRHHEFLQ